MNFQSLIRFFLRGLLLIVPVGLTFYVIVAMVAWMDNLLPYKIPGLGIITVIVATTFIGYLANTIFAKPFLIQNNKKCDVFVCL